MNSLYGRSRMSQSERRSQQPTDYPIKSTQSGNRTGTRDRQEQAMRCESFDLNLMNGRDGDPWKAATD